MVNKHHQSIYRVTIQGYRAPLVLLSALLHDARSEISHGSVNLNTITSLSSSVVGSSITIDWTCGTDLRYWHGMIISMRVINHLCVELNVRSLLYKLTQVFQPKHYVNTDVKTVLQDVLLPLYDTSDIVFAYEKTVPARELVIHQQGDHFTLMERLLHEHGLYCYEKHTQDGAQIIIRDTGEAYGHVPSIQMDMKEAVSVYHWKNPAETHVETLMTGVQVNDILNDNLIVVAVTHYLNESEAVALGTTEGALSRYRAHIVAQARNAVFQHPPKQGHAPTTQLRLAKVHRFDQGKYQLILDHEQSLETAVPTTPVASLTPYGGDDFGLHWPLPDEAEIMTLNLNGDVDHPIIVGALSRSLEKHQNQFKSAAGHELMFDDTPHQPSIRLSAMGERCYLHMETRPAEELISLCNTAGGIDIHAGGALQLKSGDGYLVDSGTDVVLTAHQHIQISSDEADIVMRSGASTVMSAGEDMKVDIGKNLTMDVKGRYIMHSQAGYTMDIAEGDYRATLHQGSMSWSARDAVNISCQSGDITLSCGESSMTLLRSGEITIKGRKLELIATDIDATHVEHMFQR